MAWPWHGRAFFQASQRVTLSSEGPLLGLLLEPFKLQVRRGAEPGDLERKRKVGYKLL